MIPAILAALEGASAAGGASAAAGAAGAGEAAAGLGSLGQITQKLTGSLQQLNPSMQKLVGTITAAPAKVLEFQSAIVHTFDTFVKAAAAPINTIKMLGDSISQFVRLASPASVTMFNYRVENAMAALGKHFLPILDALGRAADRTNEAFNKMGPALDTLAEATSEIIDAMGSGLVVAMQMAAPTIKIVGESLKITMGIMEGLGRVAIQLVPGMLTVAGLMERIFGGVDKDAGKSVAARPARLTSAEEVQREAAKRSLEASFAAMAGEKKKETTESWLEKILKFLDQNLSKDALKALLSELADMIRSALPNIPNLPNLPSVGGLPSIPLNPLGTLLDLVRD